jgi:hypothetical protein
MERSLMKQKLVRPILIGGIVILIVVSVILIIIAIVVRKKKVSSNTTSWPLDGASRIVTNKYVMNNAIGYSWSFDTNKTTLVTDQTLQVTFEKDPLFKDRYFIKQTKSGIDYYLNVSFEQGDFTNTSYDGYRTLSDTTKSKSWYVKETDGGYYIAETESLGPMLLVSGLSPHPWPNNEVVMETKVRISDPTKYTWILS